MSDDTAAEDWSAAAGGREMVSSATLQVCVPDAPFPPPFPTSKPYRAYLANMVGGKRISGSLHVLTAQIE